MRAVVLPFILVIAVAAGEVYDSKAVSKIISVYDGDTFRCNIEGYPDIVGENIGIRVKGIDTPEMRDKRPEIKAKAIAARDYLRARLAEAETIELREIERGKYFRLVAYVYIDGINVSQELIEKGLALPYDGGTKAKW